MRRFFHNPYRALEKTLGYAFRKRRLLETALAHPSYRFERADVEHDNQRLEFLGDAALTLVAGEHVYATFPDLQEGALTNLRSQLTSGKALAQVARAVDLGAYLLLGKGERLAGGHGRPSTLSDAMEAVLGAAYLDGGLKAVARVFQKAILPAIAIHPEDLWADNAKGRLQQWTQQRYKTDPVYRVAHALGPAHARQFTVHVWIRQQQVGVGSGPTKRDAEQQAARTALQQIEQPRP